MEMDVSNKSTVLKTSGLKIMFNFTFEHTQF